MVLKIEHATTIIIKISLCMQFDNTSYLITREIKRKDLDSIFQLPDDEGEITIVP